MLLHWTLSSQFWTFFAITKTKHVFFFFTQIGLRCLSLHYIGSQWVKTVYMKQTIDTTQLKPSMLVVMNSTSNNPNVTFNHIQHEHAWTDLLSALQQDCLAALRLWMQIPVQPVSSLSIEYLHAIGFLFENEHRPVTVTLRLRDGFDAVCLMTLEIWFSILHWSSLGTCYLSSHCSGGRLVIFSCGLKSRSRGVSFPAKKKTNWQEDGEIKDAAQKHDGFTPKCSYQYVKVLVSQKLLEKSSAGSVSRSNHVTIIWNITPRIPSTYRSSVCVGHISRKACKDYTLHVLLHRNVSSYLKCFSSI